VSGGKDGHGRLVDLDTSAVADVRAGELGVRFVFGAAISGVAGVVSLAWGAGAGGMFLAFPAILPATITLIERNESVLAARHDVAGAVLGASGMVAFAVTGVWAFDHLRLMVALLASLLAWCAVALTAYLLWASIRKRKGKALDE